MTSLSETNRGTLIGCSAIVIWATLSTLTGLVGNIPAFQLAAIGFVIASLFVVLKWIIRKEDVGFYFKQRPAVWMVGVGGIFGFHFFYFLALRNAPIIEAALIVYFWPLLLILLSALFTSEQRLKLIHVVGVLLGLSGTFVLLLGDGFEFKSEYWLGYGAAAGAALTWAVYSILTRKQADVPNDFVGVLCMVSGLLSWICHMAFEETVLPVGWDYLVLVIIGIGPMGIAFFVWDHGVKRGNMRTMAMFSYTAPLLSAFLLVASGQATLSTTVALACILIVAGAVLGGLDMIKAPSKAHPRLSGK